VITQRSSCHVFAKIDHHGVRVQRHQCPTASTPCQGPLLLLCLLPIEPQYLSLAACSVCMAGTAGTSDRTQSSPGVNAQRWNSAEKRSFTSPRHCRVSEILLAGERRARATTTRAPRDHRDHLVMLVHARCSKERTLMRSEKACWPFIYICVLLCTGVCSSWSRSDICSST